MTDKNGWIKLHRKIEDNWLWENDKPFDKRSAWIDILLMVNHKKNKILFDNELVEVSKGERITSERKLAEKWGWSRTKVRNFLELLEKDDMIEVEKTTKKTTLKVVNFGKYQDKETGESTTEEPDGNQSSTSGVPGENTNKNVKNVEECIKNDNHDASVDERKILKILNSINKYPFDFEKDLKHIRKLMTKHPEVDILEEIDKWETWLIDNPLKKKSNPRLQITNWMKNASEGRYNNSNNDDKKVDERTVDYDEIRELMKDE